MMKTMQLPKILHKYPLRKVLLLLFMLVLLGVGAIPGYITGKWAWDSPPSIANLKQLKQLQKTGVKVSGWETQGQEVLPIGGHKWLRLQLQKDPKTQAIVLFLNQSGPQNQPQVEWMDLDGYWRWKTDSYQSLEFGVDREDLKVAAREQSADSKPVDRGGMPEVAQVKARFFRGWTDRQTYAIAQWYAWPQGGESSASGWFWRDRLAQLQNKRVPWVAVSVIIPIEPLGDLEKVRPLAESLSKKVQAALMSGPFAEMQVSSR